MRQPITLAALMAYLTANGFKPAQGRIGLSVYRKRKDAELTIGPAFAHEYDLKRGRKVIKAWDIVDGNG